METQTQHLETAPINPLELTERIEGATDKSDFVRHALDQGFGDVIGLSNDSEGRLSAEGSDVSRSASELSVDRATLAAMRGSVDHHQGNRLEGSRRPGGADHFSVSPSLRAAASYLKNAEPGNPYAPSAALDKTEGDVHWEIADQLIASEVITGNPDGALNWLKRASLEGKVDHRPEQSHGLEWMNKVWEVSEHKDVGLESKMYFAQGVVEELSLSSEEHRKDAKLISAEELASTPGVEELWDARLEQVEAELGDVYLQQLDAVTQSPDSSRKDYAGLRADLFERVSERYAKEMNAFWWGGEYSDDKKFEASDQLKQLVEAEIKLRTSFLEKVTAGDLDSSGSAEWATELGDLTGFTQEGHRSYATSNETGSNYVTDVLGEDALSDLGEAAKPTIEAYRKSQAPKRIGRRALGLVRRRR